MAIAHYQFEAIHPFTDGSGRTGRILNILLRALLDATITHVRARAPKIYSRELVDIIFEKPYARIADVVDRGLAARQTASRYLAELARIGVLEPRVVGREKLFVHPRLLRLLIRDKNDHETY